MCILGAHASSVRHPPSDFVVYGVRAGARGRVRGDMGRGGGGFEGRGAEGVGKGRGEEGGEDTGRQRKGGEVEGREWDRREGWGGERRE